MPGQRMSHPEQSMSQKVTKLSDFEYRAWEQTKLSSDDFGVMPYSSTVLRADNLRLRKATEKQVFDALSRIKDVGLLLLFEHQGETYACSPVWQKWQQVRFPRKTSRPCPPPDVLSQCNDETRELFAQHPGGRKKSSGQIPDKVPESSDRKSGHSDDEVPANADANASAHAQGGAGGQGPSPLIIGPLAFEKLSKTFSFVGARIRVPHVLHDELRTKLGGTQPDVRLRDWYHELDRQAAESGEAIPDIFPWLRPKFIAWVGESADDSERAKFLGGKSA